MGSSTYFGGSHLSFRKLPLKKGCKLHEYTIKNEKFDSRIGTIHWRGGWRQYVSQTDEGVDMSVSCHKEVTEFIEKLMKEWRNARKKR